MLYVVLFEDDPTKADMRPQHMPAHLAFLEKHGRQILSAGPLSDERGQGAGGLWLVEAESAGAVDALVKADPFWPTGLRKGVRILAWKQVFAEGKRRV
ncbi:MAG TPA: YciI family protein [Kiloniellales bacterium]|nr:YciI family protein [Kiloniellales bacterium]